MEQNNNDRLMAKIFLFRKLLSGKRGLFNYHQKAVFCVTKFCPFLQQKEVPFGFLTNALVT
jgi:hypothetical protein